jgi:acyl-CoA synthetase (NDP forming)
MNPVRDRTSRMLLEPDAAALLGSRGITYVEHAMAAYVVAAAAAAARIGYPVVLKVVSADVVHKTEVGGVVVDVRDEEALRAGYEQVMERVSSRSPDAAISGVLVSRYAKADLELIIGGIRDATFGATVMVGLGGIFAEALGDVTFRVAPIAQDDGIEMLRDLKGAGLLSGFRGARPVDLTQVADVLVKVGELLLTEPCIQEIDLNPVAVSAQACVALDARVIVEDGAEEGPAR